MKIKSFMLAVAVCSMIIVSCGNSQKSESASNNDSVAIENVADSIEGNDEKECLSDSSEVVTRGGSSSEGFGRCSKCSCKEFEGRGDVCRNCGHAYKAHY